jgi:hypothetical protein
VVGQVRDEDATEQVAQRDQLTGPHGPLPALDLRDRCLGEREAAVGHLLS